MMTISKRATFSRVFMAWALLGVIVGLVILLSISPTYYAGAATGVEQGNPPPTPTPGPTPTPPGPGCRDVLVNGNFESAGGWITYSALGVSVISSFPPPSGAYHSGRRGAYLGDYNLAHDFIAQQVNLPANATKAVLQYWWQVETQESALQPYDTLTVFVDRPFGQATEVLEILSNQNADPAWYVSAYDILRYRGRTITLRWEAKTDANRPTAFYVDDVMLLLCVDTTLRRHAFFPWVAR